MKLWRLLAAGAAFFFSTACVVFGIGLKGGGAPTATSPSPSAPTSTAAASAPDVLIIPADPLAITIQLDAASQAEALIPAAGGQLSATGTDGTQFLLHFPPGALAVDTLIRLTPVTHIDGLPLGSGPLAVQIEPEGLPLYEFATLTITPTQAIPLDRQLFFGYQGTGQNLVLASPVTDSKEIRIQILHFSGYGVSQGALADIAPLRARLGGDAEARLQSAVAEQVAKARLKELLGIEDKDPADLVGPFQQFEEQVIKPRLAAARESCAAGRLAIETLKAYERQRQLLGLESDGSALLDKGLIADVAARCLKEEYELCRDQHVLHRIIPAAVSIERLYQLLGANDDAVNKIAENYIRRCLTFRLEFHSQALLISTSSGKTVFDSTVDAVVKLQVQGLTIQGQAPLVNTAFEKIPDPGCAATTSRGGGTFDAFKLAFIIDRHSAQDTLGYVRDYSLTFYPGITSQSYVEKCPDTTISFPPRQIWTSSFMLLHKSEWSTSGDGVVAENWKVLGGELLATKEWSIKDESNTEAGYFKLYHTPQ